MATTPRPLKGPPVHPGEILREEVIPGLGKSKAEVAELLQISRMQLHDILAERRPVTPQMALRIGKLVGNGPDLWMNLQVKYDLAQASEELKDTLKNIPTLGEAATGG